MSICPISGCINNLNGRKVCDMHYRRYSRHGHYESLRPKIIIPDGYVKHCIHHGFLTLDQVRKFKRGFGCKRCLALTRLKTNFIEPDPSLSERKCGGCNTIKSVSEFSPYNSKMRWPRCKFCTQESNARLYAKHKNHLKKHYNMTPTEYNKMLEKQNGCCAICKRTANEVKVSRKGKKENNLSVDHCHKAEKEGIIKIRGLLCFHCNFGLGMWKDSIEVLKSAIQYLENI